MTRFYTYVAARFTRSSTITIIALGGCATASADDPQTCPPQAGIAVQILGSGGPIADDDRAGSGYLVWIGGRARVMIDAGTATVLRFAEAGARFEDVDFLGISHFHTDHSAELPALLKSGNFSRRTRPLVLAGPAGNARFPGLGGFLGALLDPDTGAFRYLSGYLDGSGGLVRLEPRTVDLDTYEPVVVYEDAAAGLRVDALPVPHGIVPAVAFRVAVGDTAIVFGSDQTLSEPSYLDFAREADLLVAHMAIPETATGTATELHARPSAIGAAADTARVDALLLSHFMARSLADLERNVDIVDSRYDGRIEIASDLGCITLH